MITRIPISMASAFGIAWRAKCAANPFPCGFSVKSEERLEDVAEDHVGIANTRRSELFGSE